jgi:hypothetical protein
LAEKFERILGAQSLTGKTLYSKEFGPRYPALLSDCHRLGGGELGSAHSAWYLD